MRSRRHDATRLFSRSLIILFLAFTNSLCQTVKSRAPETTHRDTGQVMDAWINVFPVGPKVYDLTADVQNPARVYAATHKGLFVTNNSGMTWQAIYPTAADNLLFAQSRSNPNVMFVGVRVGQRGGLVKSVDAGAGWQRIAAEDINWPPLAIAIDPKNPDVVYVMNETVLRKSLNGGRTWGDVTPQANSGQDSIRTPLHFLWIDPANPAHLLVGCSRTGDASELAESRDGGTSWQPSNVEAVARRNPAATENNEGIWPFVAPDPLDHQVIFAISPSVGDHVYHVPGAVISLDGGQSWKDVTIRDHEQVVSIKYVLWSKLTARRIYIGTDVGLFVSSDAGARWGKVLPYGIEAITETAANQVFAATWFGIFKSADGTKSWHHASLGIPVKMDEPLTSNATPGVPETILDFGPASSMQVPESGPIYIGGRGGYWASSDLGLSWEWHAFSADFHKLSSADVAVPTPGGQVRQIVKAADNTLFMSLFEYGNVSSEAKFLRVQPDGEVTRLNPNNPASMIGLSPDDKQTLYMTGGGGSQPTPQSGRFLSKSEDGGFSWRTFDFNSSLRSDVSGSSVFRVPTFVVSKRSSKVVYVLCLLNSSRPVSFSQQIALLRTIDGGDHWQDVFPEKAVAGVNTWPNFNFIAGDFARLALGSSGSQIYLALNNVLFKSTNGGESWSRMPVSAGVINDISVDSKGKAFLATQTGIWTTNDGGAHWDSITQGLLGDNTRQIVATLNGVFARGQYGVYRLIQMPSGFESALRARWDELEKTPRLDPLCPRPIAAGSASVGSRTGTTDNSATIHSVGESSDSALTMVYERSMQNGRRAFDISAWDEALTNFQTAAQQDPTGDAWLWIGKTQLAAGHYSDFTGAWDEVLRRNHPLALPVCLAHGISQCHVGVLEVGRRSVRFVAGETSIFESPPAGIEPLESSRHKMAGYADFKLQVVANKYDLIFIPYGVTCQILAHVNCPANGTAQQMAVGDYVERTVARLAAP
ncbi:MAG TPA: hypothetical protein VMG82_40465 [Candidatus Sulfotelmatobacter sp.]|nr:hypothetical protein [Candidatus Sulfotelmatobacter sp.]